MTFIKFLRELDQVIQGSNLYTMTKRSVQILLSSRQHCETDKNIIFDAISNDVHRNNDPLSLRKLWNERIKDSKLRFE